jgi:hypothetical protein
MSNAARPSWRTPRSTRFVEMVANRLYDGALLGGKPVSEEEFQKLKEEEKSRIRPS